MQTKEDFFERKHKEIGVKLNTVQQQTVTSTDGAVLLLASPGSGKTTTIIMRIGYLIEEKGVKPQRIKAVTFSRAAAQDMKERFTRFFPELPPVDFSTIHSLAYEIVREHFRKTQTAYQLIEGRADLDKKLILRELFKTIVGENITEDQMEDLMTYISFIKNKLIGADKWSEVKCDVPQAAQILEKYEEFKRTGTDKLLLDYDDMLVIANEALASDSELLAKYQQLYDYVLTDESQDTSFVQHAIIEKLVRSHGNLCVVADDDQAIYSWRGAEPSYLLRFKQVYPQALILFMEQNYRSTKDIVDVANRFIKRNKNRYNKNMFTANAAHKPVTIRKLADYNCQAKYLVQEIKQFGKFAQAAVLYRNNSSSIMLINEFDRAGIPFFIGDTDNRFFSHWVVEDILNFMRLTYSDKRLDIFEKIYTRLNGYVTRQQLAALKTIHNNESVFTNLLNYVKLQDYQIKQLQECHETIRQMKGMAPLAAIMAIRKQLGYEKALERMCERFGFRKEYLLGILNTLEAIADKLTTMEEFAGRLKYLETITKTAKLNKGNAVTLSTFHSAKGLEFERVYMIDLVEGIIPSNDDTEQNRKGDAQALEEAVRLFYVGMTRAKRELELITYDERNGEKMRESQFVTDVRNILNSPVLTAKKKTRQFSITSQYSHHNPYALKTKDQLKIGSVVRHPAFGRGEIIALDSENIDIRFTREIKKLSIRICLESGLLEPAGREDHRYGRVL